MAGDPRRVIENLQDPERFEQAVEQLAQMLPAPDPNQDFTQQAQGGAAPQGAPAAPVPSQGAPPVPPVQGAPVLPAQTRPVPGADPNILAQLLRGVPRNA